MIKPDLKNREELFLYYEKQIATLEREIEGLNRQVADLFSELEVTPEQLTSFIENRDNFTEKNWEEIQKHKQLLQELLDRDLAQIVDPRKTAESRRSCDVKREWLFIR